MKTTVTLLSLLTVLSLAIPQTLQAQSGAGSPVATADSADPAATSDGSQLMNADRLMQLVPGLTQSEAVTLAQTGAVTADYSGAISARIAPPFAGKDAMLKELNKTEATVGIELLFQAPIPKGYRDRKDFWLETYNIMRSISTLKGIKYYSADRNIMRTFYYDAYAVPSPEQEKTRLPDPVVSTIPASSHIFTYHKDSSFGNYVMSIDYTAGPDPQNPQYARMAMSNATTMYYSIIPIERPYKLQIDLVVVPVGDTMLFYGNFVANTLTLFGLRDSVDVSFTNRVKALYAWFMDEIRLNTP
ncbi:MAG TPA: DUF6675 family protein [Spirochaetia bacterium]|nr:DUF6675 family protein [Spirochaetia bacterium]